MINYSLFSSTGNLIDRFDNERPALSALKRIVETDPESADDDVALLISNDQGTVAEGPIYGELSALRVDPPLLDRKP